ncbi:glycosyltransferase family 17 [Colletotrichum paranaense]|uniref:Glycosyltransferase family 17 n=1 Tax=Colletotrichum paranaense TaxID=1914294 RepID=A0ABQ9SKD1_9PEZI|nr:glycosyltransferase family 17 [Colletotrichum paranaense]KAK1538095.1 glycosyltransferase family 17 [Colletotrichum paranaense]
MCSEHNTKSSQSAPAILQAQSTTLACDSPPLFLSLSSCKPTSAHGELPKDLKTSDRGTSLPEDPVPSRLQPQGLVHGPQAMVHKPYPDDWKARRARADQGIFDKLNFERAQANRQPTLCPSQSSTSSACTPHLAHFLFHCSQDLADSLPFPIFSSLWSCSSCSSRFERFLSGHPFLHLLPSLVLISGRMMNKPTSSHQIKYLAVVASLVFIWLVWRLDLHTEVAEHARKITHPNSTPYDGLAKAGNSEVLPPAKAVEYCDHFRLKPANTELVRKRKVYDLLLINTEVEMLEVRLGQMAPYVDYFVILESALTFTDNQKPLYIKENWDLFKPWHHKMILREMDLEALKESSTWDREAKSRNAMYEQVIPTLEGEQQASIDDILIVSDVDEIPKPEVLRALRNCEIPPRVSIHSKIYYYSYQWLSRNDWNHPQATVYRGVDTVLPHDLRHNANDHHFNQGGWHCSYCFSTVEEMAQKINSFSHAELNKPEFKDPDWIVSVARRGHDIFGRGESNFDRIEENHDVPDYVKKNSDKFKYLLDRDPLNANFRDYTPKATSTPAA